MLKVLVREGVMRLYFANGLGPKESCFLIPKSTENASLVCSVALFNRERREGLAKLQLRAVEIVELIMWLEIHDTRGDLSETYGRSKKKYLILKL